MIQKFTRNTPLIGIMFVCLLWSTGFAMEITGTPEEKGLKVSQMADKNFSGFKNVSSELKMILENNKGQKTERVLKNKTLEMKDDGDKSLIIFDNPRDIKGTAFLSFAHKKGPDDQWLYLPSLKRVKRIASANKSGPFLGSEFAFEDISSEEVEKYTYKYIKEEKLNGQDCHVIERYPVDKKSGYTKQVVWYDKEHFRQLKIDFYDRKKSHLKTLEYKGYKKYLENHWRPSEMQMTNVQNKKKTSLVFSDYKFDNKFTERDFDKNSLKRAR